MDIVNNSVKLTESIQNLAQMPLIGNICSPIVNAIDEQKAIQANNISEGLIANNLINKGIFCIHSANKIFPKEWLNSAVPVIFDFMGIEHLTNNQDLRNYLYCFIPQKLNNESIVIFCSREQFIQTCKDDNITTYFKNLTENIIKTQQLLQKHANMVVIPRVSYTRHRYYSRKHRRFSKERKY